MIGKALALARIILPCKKITSTIQNGCKKKPEFMQCYPQHLHMRKGRINQGKDREEEGKKRWVNMERHTVRIKKREGGCYFLKQ